MRIKPPFQLLLFGSFLASLAQAQQDKAALVNPFIGTGGHGHTYPGASRPFGMMQLGPDTRLEGWDGCSGYHYSDSLIYGFSHTHLSGTGVADYCDILMMPYTGNVEWDNRRYASPFSHTREIAEPGYYSVHLDKHDIRVRLATAERSGMHEYRFPQGVTTGNVLLDLVHRDRVLDSYIEKVSDTEFRGYRRSQSWARDQVVYFHLQFERPVQEHTFTGGDELEVKRHLRAKGTAVKAAFTFDASAGPVRIKIGISGVSMDGARANLDREIPGWNFESVRQEARAAWNRELGKIDVKGGTTDQQVIFYTALYHAMLNPNLYTDVDGLYRGTDGQVHRADGFTNYTVFSLWDTYRALHPLHTLLDRKRTLDWVQTFLAQYRNGGLLPVWELSGNETFCMIGYHSVPVIADAYQKGIRGFDTRLALEAMRSYAESDRFGLHQYRNHGYLAAEMEHESVSKTLEYAYDDWCIARFAKATGQDSAGRAYFRRSQYYKNLYDPSTGHMRGKKQSVWHTPFDPREVNNYFTEGNSWQYSFMVPHDVEGLIRLSGGRAVFARRLDRLFTEPSVLTGRDQADVTGLIGQYAHGNEPSHHMAYLFAHAGKPWRTQEIVHRICTAFYKNAPDGLIGNEDCGQMSAWFVWSALGLYPVCPGDGTYVLGTPLFDEAVLHLEDGKTVTIRAERKTAGAFYVHDVRWNGGLYTRSFLSHDSFASGGTLQFTLGDRPDTLRGTAAADRPLSEVTEAPVVAVPYVDIPDFKFKERIQVVLRSPDPSARIRYRVLGSGLDSAYRTYRQPFSVTASVRLEAFAEKGGVRSHTVLQQLYRMPRDKRIRVRSAVHPLYTAGGPEALIDGIQGTANWRTGEWQSYFDSDLIAEVDLLKVRDLHYAAVHVLQDVGPWILFPKELIVEASTDGVTYREAGRVSNTIPVREGPAELQELGTTVSVRARYLRFRAVNGGKLPAGHESAGYPSHLFVDELIVR